MVFARAGSPRGACRASFVCLPTRQKRYSKRASLRVLLVVQRLRHAVRLRWRRKAPPRVVGRRRRFARRRHDVTSTRSSVSPGHRHPFVASPAPTVAIRRTSPFHETNAHVRYVPRHARRTRVTSVCPAPSADVIVRAAVYVGCCCSGGRCRSSARRNARRPPPASTALIRQKAGVGGR